MVSNAIKHGRTVLHFGISKQSTKLVLYLLFSAHRATQRISLLCWKNVTILCLNVLFPHLCMIILWVVDLREDVELRGTQSTRQYSSAVFLYFDL